MTLVFSDVVSNRLVYTLDYVFSEHGIEYEVTTDVNKFHAFEGAKFAYSAKIKEDNGRVLEPSALLFDTKLNTLTVEKSVWKETECLSIDRVCDPLASIFYVLSRYEEYLPFEADNHGRFLSKNSVLHKYGWLHIQIVEHWVKAVLTTFCADEYSKIKKTAQFIPTFDIDIAFSHLWKGNFRNFFAASKDLILLKFHNINTRRKVLTGVMHDPYDSFDAIEHVSNEFCETRIFWHLGTYGKYDKNISRNNPNHQQLIRKIAMKSKIGLHPSYASNLSIKVLKKESSLLNAITNRPIKESRQHFLKLTFPETYMMLMHAGFEKDYSMGYADDVGFRAGTAHIHTFFNVLENRSYPEFRIVPFCYMDGTLKDYLKLDTEKSKQLISKLMVEVKEYGGVFSFIWHNHSFAEADSWKGWRSVFTETVTLWKGLK